jgi:TolA-binding protein
MKMTLKMMVFTVLAFGLFACGGKTLTQNDLKKAEASLFNEDKSLNEATAPQVAETYCKYVEQNPDDSTAVEWLYHAMEINVMLKNADKSIELCDQLLQQYPQSKWAPMSLFLVGSYVYNDQLNDTAQAHAAFQRLIDNYPESALVDDAQMSIEYLGLTPDEIMTLIMMSQMEED